MENIMFSLKEVEKLVKNAYEVGYCNGLDSEDIESVSYRNSDDFWNKNCDKWKVKDIDYVS